MRCVLQGQGGGAPDWAELLVKDAAEMKGAMDSGYKQSSSVAIPKRINKGIVIVDDGSCWNLSVVTDGVPTKLYGTDFMPGHLEYREIVAEDGSITTSIYASQHMSRTNIHVIYR